MKFALPLFASTALAASTLIAPSSFVYSNSSVSAIAGESTTTTSKQKSTIYDTVTATDISKVTHTVCGANGCYLTTDVVHESTYTTVINGVLTTVVTQVTDGYDSTTTIDSTATSAVTETEIIATVITITSCSANKCHPVPVTTGVQVITEDSTTYTTFCPLTTSTPTTAPAPTTTPAPKPSTIAGESTVTEINTTVVTITSCSENKCHEVPVTTGVTTVIEDSTTYTTYCPLTTSSAPVSTTVAPVSVSTATPPPPVVPSTKTDLETTVVTITSCSENKCHSTPVTTGVTTITNEKTTYVTYCPLTSTTVVAPTTPTTAPVPTLSTVNVIENITTVSPSTAPVVPSSQVASSTATISTYAGAAASVKQSGIVGLVSIILFALL
jgi:hypothetical protein